MKSSGFQQHHNELRRWICGLDWKSVGAEGRMCGQLLGGLGGVMSGSE